MGKRSPSEDSDGSRERRRRKQKRAKAKEKEKEDSDGEGRRKRKKEKRSRSRSAASVDTTPHRCGLGASAARLAAWPRLAGGWGSLGSDLPLREASGAPLAEARARSGSQSDQVSSQACPRQRRPREPCGRIRYLVITPPRPGVLEAAPQSPAVCVMRADVLAGPSQEEWPAAAPRSAEQLSVAGGQRRHLQPRPNP